MSARWVPKFKSIWIVRKDTDVKNFQVQWLTPGQHSIDVIAPFITVWGALFRVKRAFSGHVKHANTVSCQKYSYSLNESYAIQRGKIFFWWGKAPGYSHYWLDHLNGIQKRDFEHLGRPSSLQSVSFSSSLYMYLFFFCFTTRLGKGFFSSRKKVMIFTNTM